MFSYRSGSPVSRQRNLTNGEEDIDDMRLQVGLGQGCVCVRERERERV